MRCAALLVCALMAAQAHGYSEEYVRANSKLLWRAFKNDHGKHYSSLAEEERRYGIFAANMMKASRFEKEQTKGATFGMNVFSDLSEEEFQSFHNLRVPKKASPPAMFTAEEEKAVQASVDWRAKGAVTHVKNQGQCGSCWAFSTTGGIEGQWQLSGKTLTSVSEQELVSCDKVDAGCNGGLMDNAFKWLIKNHRGQIVTESSYPYKSGTGVRHACESVAAKTVGATIRSYKDITHSEEQMKAFVSTSGPLSIAVDANKWQTYSSGILTNCCTIICRLDHGVLIVGYGDNYWIVKNSWGSSWGESGYIRVAYGSNECGLNQTPSTSVV
eukprot:TRINITY_DN164_c0_g1_i16.p2 TRINITY_DN164_c0_g1~~TRINITY_DN164_c0_g1_i16.p2  ORF type:complete len:328 (+),score=133.75 TRINITY_DN164_c0_g1_i16:61-1044(+)